MKKRSMAALMAGAMLLIGNVNALAENKDDIIGVVGDESFLDYQFDYDENNQNVGIGMAKQRENFANKYVYDEEKQNEIFEEHPEYYGGLAKKKLKDGTINIMLAHYDDAFAALTGEAVQYRSNVLVNGEAFDGRIYKDRMIVSADVFKLVGCEVETDYETAVTTISRGENTIEIMPYTLVMRKDKENGYWRAVEICARYVGEEKAVYVPLRAVAEELGLSVEWDNDLHMAVLNG